MTSTKTDLTALEVVNSFLADCGTSHEELTAAVRTWCSDDIQWSMPGRPSNNLTELLETLEFMREQGVEFVTYTVEAELSDGELVMQQRRDRLHGADGSVLAEMPMMSVNRVRNSKIVFGRDYMEDTSQFPDLFAA